MTQIAVCPVISFIQVIKYSDSEGECPHDGVVTAYCIIHLVHSAFNAMHSVTKHTSTHCIDANILL